MTNLVEITVRINDAEADVSIDKLTNKLRELGRQTYTPSVELQGAAKAIIESKLTSDAIQKVGKSSADSGDKTGRSFLSMLNPIKRAHLAISGASGFASGLGRMIVMAPEVSIVVGAALAAIAAACAPVVAAIIPITIGFGGLAIVAISEFKKIELAISKGGKAMKALSPAERDVANTMIQLKGEFGKLSKAVQPEIIKAFALALKIIKDLMPAIRPLMIAAGKATDAFLSQMNNWLKSPSGRAFVHWLATQGPKDIKIFGRIMWDTFVGIGLAFDHLYRAGIWLENYFAHKFIPNVEDVFRNLYQWIYHDFVQRIYRFFVSTIPTAFDIWKEKVRIVWDDIKIQFLKGVLYITTTMGHLPGPLGAPFRKASTDIRASLAKIQGDVRNAADNINRDWEKLHGKAVTLRFNIPGPFGGKLNALSHMARGGGVGSSGTFMVGEEGPEIVHLPQGAHVFSNPDTQRMMSGLGGAMRGLARGTVNLAPTFNIITANIAGIGQQGMTLAEDLTAIGASGRSYAFHQGETVAPAQSKPIKLVIGPPPGGGYGGGTAEREYQRALANLIRYWVRVDGGGDVQVALGGRN